MPNNPSFIQPSDRIANSKPYFFASLNSTINTLKASGIDVIRIDMGSPDLPPDKAIIETLVENAVKPNVHGYTPNGGTIAFHQAIAAYYHNRFGVEIDPLKESIALLGSKEGLFNLSQVILNPGDVVIVPDPAYPTYEASAIIAGAQVYRLPLLSENGFLPDLSAIPQDIANQAKLLWLNYPNNPTGVVAPFSFFEEAVNFARKNRILIAHDAPYADVCFDAYIAPSIMQVPGAKDISIEFNSLSKTYNMAGWRLGMAVGNAEVLRLLHTYKSQMDSSHFGPMLQAGIQALTGDQDWILDRNKVYQTRRDLVLAGLHSAGFSVEVPRAAIYVWAHLPTGYSNSAAFCDLLLHETGVSITPGIVYGKHGEGYVRISLGTPTERIQEAMNRLVGWLQSKEK